VDRWNAIEQSIFAEAEVADLFKSFATAFYALPAAQDFWQRMARAEAGHVLMLEFDKWRMVREELDLAQVKYADPALLRQFKKFDEIRGVLIHPPAFPQALAVALKAEESCLLFHDDRIFIEDFGVSDGVISALMATEEEHQAILKELLAAPDPMAALSSIDLSRIGDYMIE
jgi:hypothetical protein